MLKWTFSAPLAALAVTGCSLFQTPAVPDLPDPPEPNINRFAGIKLPEQNEALPVYADPALDALRSPVLAKFRSEEEFLSWLKAVREASAARGVHWWRGMPPVAMSAPVAEAAPPPPGAAPPPPPPPPPPSADAPTESITVTGSAVPGSEDNPEITNNQKAGVDEGSIVKQIGTHLVVLQDGRLFITDLMPGGEPGLKLADRANVYRSSREDTWYDEILVAGRTILVTGYSYREAASEFTVLSLGEDGKVTRDATFYISSDDYYSGSNYATRMIDGKLVIHTPVYLSGRGWWTAFDPPVIREWRREEDDGFRERTELETGRPLFRAEDIWMPVQRLAEPVVHMVTVCDIAGATDTSAPVCNATAIVGSETHEFLVTKDAFWLWLSPTWDERDHEGELACEDKRAGLQDIAPSVLVRLPIDGAKPSVLSVRGEPQNQFSMDMDAGSFRAVLDWYPAGCGPWDRPDAAELAYFDTPLDALSDVLEDTAGGRYFDLPSPGASDYEARFTEAHLVYGAREGWGSWPPPEGEPRDNGRAIIVPVDDPARPVTLELPHDVIRAERAGPYMALTGYHDHTGLSLSLIDLRGEPRLSGSLVLKDRFESENRSHAFNSRIDGSGEGLIGLPTIPKSTDAARWWWWSQSSDMTYVAAAADGSLSAAGLLEATRLDPAEASATGYVCEVSCVDWYGNARPIFTGGRLLALLNSELVEGELKEGTVSELRRIDLTAPLAD
ncbi:MAG: beta-propeller domain-containing protein [Hyphomonas sp.]